MTPQEFVDWGLRLADALAAKANTYYFKASEYDHYSIGASNCTENAAKVAKVMELPGATEKLAAVAVFSQAAVPDPARWEESESQFLDVYRVIEPTLEEILDESSVAAWVGDWEFNDDGSIGSLSVSRGSEPTAKPWFKRLEMSYTDHAGVVYDVAVTGYTPSGFQFTIKTNPSRTWSVHAYLFDRDRTKMAGFVESGSRTRGFYALKKPRVISLPPPLPSPFTASSAVPPPLPPA